MPFSPTIPDILSKALPGVKFTIRRIGFGRRTDLDFKTLTFRQRLRELEADHPPRSDQEKQLGEQLAIATKKANVIRENLLELPADQFDAAMAAEYDPVVKADVEPLAAELAACVPPETKKRRAVLNEEYMQVENRIQAEWIHAGLVSIEGGDVDGMTAEQLLDYGPPELAREIYGALVSDGRLQGEETKNSPSPTTSGAVAGGESPSTTAAPVEAPPIPITSSGTASGISPET